VLRIHEIPPFKLVPKRLNEPIKNKSLFTLLGTAQ